MTTTPTPAPAERPGILRAAVAVLRAEFPGLATTIAVLEEKAAAAFEKWADILRKSFDGAVDDEFIGVVAPSARLRRKKEREQDCCNEQNARRTKPGDTYGAEEHAIPSHYLAGGGLSVLRFRL